MLDKISIRSKKNTELYGSITLPQRGAFMFLQFKAGKQARETLASPFVKINDLLRLRNRLSRGTLMGHSDRSCFFGILGGCTSDGYEQIRDHVNMSTECSLENPIEKYCLPINLGDTPVNNKRVRFLMKLVQMEISRRAESVKQNKLSFVTTVSVTDEMIEKSARSRAINQIISETAVETVGV